MRVARKRELPTGPADAWAVWGAWQGPAGQVGAIARQVSEQLGAGAETSVEVDVDGGHQRIQQDHVETDLSPRYRRSFKRMVIHGSRDDSIVEAEFDNERETTPGRGVVLRVWSDDA